MNLNELKELQAPIKNKYREDPESAIFTLKAEGKVGDGISCKVDTGKAWIESGLHPELGGSLLVFSGKIELEALDALNRMILEPLR